MAKDNLKKAIFQLKLSGAWDIILRHAYMNGYIDGHQFGKTMGTVLPSDLEAAYKEYQEILEEDIEGQKPT